MLTDLSKTWNRLEIKQKVAFQQLIYPVGLTFDGEKLGTIKKSWLFIDFMGENNQKDGVVRLSTSDWNHIEGWLEGIESLRDFEEKRLESERIKNFQRY